MTQGFKTDQYQTQGYQQRVEKPWGWEIIFTPPHASFVGKIIHIKKGFRLSLQYHDQKTESLCLYKGKAQLVIEDKTGKINTINMELQKGYFMQIGQIHRVIAQADIDVLESSIPEIGNTFRIEDDHKRPTETEALRKEKNRGWK